MLRSSGVSTKLGVARRMMWVLAFVTAVAAARYFLDPPLLLRPPLPSFVVQDVVTDAAGNVAPHLYTHHRTLFLTHVACGIVAILAGLFQFMATLRARRPALHRRLGMLYGAAVALGVATGLPLSFLIVDAGPIAVRAQFYPVVIGFASLSVAWPAVTAVAFVRARQRRFDDHRAWMIRSYALTFAAATTRIVAPLVLLATADVALSVQIGVWSWPLNLAVAEWLIRIPATLSAPPSRPGSWSRTEWPDTPTARPPGTGARRRDTAGSPGT